MPPKIFDAIEVPFGAIMCCRTSAPPAARSAICHVSSFETPKDFDTDRAIDFDFDDF